MQRLILFLVITILAASITWVVKAQQKPPEKKYKVELTLQEWDAKLNQLEWIKQQIKLSDMPTRNSILVMDSIITPFAQQIVYQINMQMRTEQNAKSIQLKDTVKPKKN